MVIIRSSIQRCGATLAAICTLVQVTDLAAQDRPSTREFAIVAGPANYDLAGTGWSWAAAARLGIPLTSVLRLEPGLEFFTYSSQFLDRVSFLLPEVTLQVQYPGQWMQPYLGVGAGAAYLIEGHDQPLGAPWDDFYLDTEDPRIEPSAHAAVGLRAGVAQNWGVLGEARVRNISFFKANNSITEFMLGFTRLF